MTSSFIGFMEQKYVRWHHDKVKDRPAKPGKEKKKSRIATWLENKMEDAKRLQDQAKKSENPWEKGKKKRK
jgi:hypothetical protein